MAKATSLEYITPALRLGLKKIKKDCGFSHDFLKKKD